MLGQVYRPPCNKKCVFVGKTSCATGRKFVIGERCYNCTYGRDDWFYYYHPPVNMKHNNVDTTGTNMEYKPLPPAEQAAWIEADRRRSKELWDCIHNASPAQREEWDKKRKDFLKKDSEKPIDNNEIYMQMMIHPDEIKVDSTDEINYQGMLNRRKYMDELRAAMHTADAATKEGLNRNLAYCLKQEKEYFKTVPKRTEPYACTQCGETYFMEDAANMCEANHCL